MTELVERARARVHAAGGRMTGQRRLILESLAALPGHPTAEEVHVRAARWDPALNLSTVYRTLHWLEAEGLVEPRRFPGHGRHDHFDLARPRGHHHFLCSQCQRVVEFDEPGIESIVRAYARRNKLRVTSTSLVLYGVCAECGSKNTTRRRQP
jgi:Fur family ferric uptake transcriptional regulator